MATFNLRYVGIWALPNIIKLDLIEQIIIVDDTVTNTWACLTHFFFPLKFYDGLRHQCKSDTDEVHLFIQSIYGDTLNVEDLCTKQTFSVKQQHKFGFWKTYCGKELSWCRSYIFFVRPTPRTSDTNLMLGLIADISL